MVKSSGEGGTRTHTPLGPTVFKTAELRPTALTSPYLLFSTGNGNRTKDVPTAQTRTF